MVATREKDCFEAIKTCHFSEMNYLRFFLVRASPAGKSCDLWGRRKQVTPPAAERRWREVWRRSRRMKSAVEKDGRCCRYLEKVWGGRPV